LVAGAVCLVVFVALTLHLIDQYRFVRSDDALVQAHFATLAAKVPGIVRQVFVEEHDHVVKGQVLAKIDDRDYQTHLKKLSEAQDALEVELAIAQKDLARATSLFSKRDITAQSFDHAKADYERKRQQIEASKATLSQATINEDYTFVRAPEDGIIALRSASPGTEVQEGDPLFGIVYPKEKWIEARIKETDLKDLHVGEAVKVEIDAIPHREFKGTLQSLSPSTEGLEAALVPDNAAGNFTKYVQRIPIRIGLSLSSEDQEIVRAGLSANIRISRRI
jgi:membrane fusion protein (multidrug efflux system)